MSEGRKIVDRFGRPVQIGSRVRVVAIPHDILPSLEPHERTRVLSMLGEVYVVEEIDVCGGVSIQKWWSVGPNQSCMHSLTLEAHEMELIE